MNTIKNNKQNKQIVQSLMIRYEYQNDRLIHDIFSVFELPLEYIVIANEGYNTIAITYFCERLGKSIIWDYDFTIMNDPNILIDDINEIIEQIQEFEQTTVIKEA